MYDIQTQLFEAQDIRLGPIDHEAHAEIESRWTHDSGFMRLMELKPVRPLPPALVRKEYEAIEKKMEEDRNLFYFTIRRRTDDVLIGKAVIEWIDWTNGSGWVHLGLGSEADRRQGLGSQALRLLLHYAFAELNLYRVGAMLPEYNTGAERLFRKFGFVEEVRRREALDRDGRRWDLLLFGQLRSEWESLAQAGGE